MVLTYHKLKSRKNKKNHKKIRLVQKNSASMGLDRSWEAWKGLEVTSMLSVFTKDWNPWWILDDALDILHFKIFWF